jgi:hypothetical protein
MSKKLKNLTFYLDIELGLLFNVMPDDIISYKAYDTLVLKNSMGNNLYSRIAAKVESDLLGLNEAKKQK